MAENESSGRFEELQQRWEQEPSSRIFTQLAEEYRRRGEPMEAVRVLEEGLKHHPASVAAQVALGRCRLEAGLLEPALAALEAVVRKDPTQMVAYRLLVEAYLQLGDATAAQERLEIYSQLNPQDPEIEVLEERIRQVETAVPSPRPPAEALEPEPDLETEPERSPLTAPPADGPAAQPPTAPAMPAAAATDPPPVAASPPAAGPEVRGGEPTTVEVETGGVAATSSPAPTLLSLVPSSHPAPNLFALVPRPLRRWQDAAEVDVEAEGAPIAAPGAMAAAFEPAGTSPGLGDEPVSEPSIEGAPFQGSMSMEEAAEWETAGGPPLVSPQVGEPEEILDGFEIEGQLEEEPAVESDMLSLDDFELTAEDEPEAAPPPPAAAPPPPAVEPVLDPGGATAKLDVREMRDAGTVGEMAEPTGSAPTVTPPSTAPPVGAPPSLPDAGPDDEPVDEETVTLGELYRRQGHTRDAEQIFKRVLDTDPDNAAARSGLDEITAQRRGPANIASLLGEAAIPEAGVTERKAKVLRNYLDLLSEGSRDDVP